MTTTTPPHHRHAWAQLRRQRLAIARAHNEPCGICGRPIDYTLDGRTRYGPTIDHTTPLAHGGDLTPPLEDLRPAHRSCNSRAGAKIGNAKRHTTRRTTPTPTTPQPQTQPATPTPPVSSGTPLTPALRGLGYPPPGIPEWVRDVPWLADLADVPPDASWPRLISPPHPDAVGTYGPEAEDLARTALGFDPRWWLRLALRMQLQHDADGRLLIGEVVESTPRRSGKSWRLRTQAMWRLRYAERFGEEQLVMHTGKDLPVCKEIIRRAWPTAEAWGWKVRRVNGQEEIERPDGGHRWVVRGRNSVYGYDVCLGMVDEAWAVEPGAVDDGLEPATMERIQAQLVLTSTAHRRATALMLRRLSSAIAGIDVEPRTLVLLWGADPDAPMADPATWRQASPHWSADRERMLAAKWAAAQRGEADADADDDDPIEAFRAQYLNVWPERVAKAARWPSPFPNWADLPRVAGDPPPGCVVAVDEAHDGSHAEVVALSGERLWWRRCDGLPDATRVALSWRPSELLVGASLVGAVTRAGARGVTPRQSRDTAAGLPMLLRAVRSGRLAHEHAEGLAAQAEGALVVVTDSGAMRLSVQRSQGSVLGLKLAAWCLARERDRVNDRPAIF